MNKLELIEICKTKSKDCINKYDFKKKYGYWYKLCCKEKIMNDVFENYSTLYQHYKNQADKYSLEYLLNFCKKITKSELITHNSSYYRLLTKYYNIDVKKIKFRKRKKADIKYSDDYLISITKDIRYKIDFLNRYPSEYKYCKNKNYFNFICPHLIPFNISLPQMILKFITDRIFNINGSLNNRKILYPYEIDIFYESLNLGFEYNGNRWHKDNLNDDLKNNKASKMGIKIITIKENSKNYELDIKSQLVNSLDEINKYKSGITIDYINNFKIDYNDIISYNIEYYKEIAKKYKNRSEFSKGNNIEYLNCKKLDIIEIISPHFVKKRIWNIDDAINESKKYDNISQFIINRPGCYQFLLKNNMIKEIKFNNRFLYKNVDSTFIKNNFSSIDELLKKNNSLYKYIKDNNISLLDNLNYYSEKFIKDLLSKIDAFSDFKKKGKIYKLSYINNQYRELVNNHFKRKNYNKYFILDINIEEISKICLDYNNIKKFRKNYPTLYKYLLKNDLIDMCFRHIDTLKFRNKLNYEKS